MLPRLRKFIALKKNRDLVSWLGGGVVVAAGGIWAVVTFFVSHDDKKPSPSTTTVITRSGPGIAAAGNVVVNAPVNLGPDAKEVAQRVADAQKPLTDQLEKLATQVARDKGVEIAPLRAILMKMGEAGVRDEDIAKRLDDKADELVKLREETVLLRQGPTELASFAQQAQALIDKGDLDGARTALGAGRAAARAVREKSSRYEAQFLAQEARVDHLQLAYDPRRRNTPTRPAWSRHLIGSSSGNLCWRKRMNWRAWAANSATMQRLPTLSIFMPTGSCWPPAHNDRSTGP
jgi:hypothetical protein